MRFLILVLNINLAIFAEFPVKARVFTSSSIYKEKTSAHTLEASTLEMTIRSNLSDRISVRSLMEINSDQTKAVLREASVTLNWKSLSISGGFFSERIGHQTLYRIHSPFTPWENPGWLWESWGSGVGTRYRYNGLDSKLSITLNDRQSTSILFLPSMRYNAFSISLLAGIQLYDVEYQDNVWTTGGMVDWRTKYLYIQAAGRIRKVQGMEYQLVPKKQTVHTGRMFISARLIVNDWECNNLVSHQYKNNGQLESETTHGSEFFWIGWKLQPGVGYERRSTIVRIHEPRVALRYMFDKKQLKIQSDFSLLKMENSKTWQLSAALWFSL